MGKREEEFRKRIANESKENFQGLLGNYRTDETEVLRRINQRW